jgi:hypothetical protein
MAEYINLEHAIRKIIGGVQVDEFNLVQVEAKKKKAEEDQLDPVDPKELKGKHADRDDPDIDNDGDSDDSDKFLHKKRKKITKAMKKDDDDDNGKEVEEAQVDEGPFSSKSKVVDKMTFPTKGVKDMGKGKVKKEEAEIDEKTKEDIVLGMKKNKEYFEKKYGDRADSVMHATANKLAQKEATGKMELDPDNPDFPQPDVDGKPHKKKKKIKEDVEYLEELKFTGKFRVGQEIRGYDFQPIKGRPARYIQGKVIDANKMVQDSYLAYAIKITNDSGKKSGGRVGDTGYIPHQVSIMEYEGRIVDAKEPIDIGETLANRAGLIGAALSRQLKDKKKEMMVKHPKTGVKVIDKKDWDTHKKKGYFAVEQSHQTRQLKDKKKEMLVKHRTTGVKVIDKKDWDDHKKKGYFAVEQNTMEDQMSNVKGSIMTDRGWKTLDNGLSVQEVDVKGEPIDNTLAEKSDGESVKDTMHNCVTHVNHEQWGYGACIPTMHAESDQDGYVDWYDIIFEHGLERHVPEGMFEIVHAEAHMHSSKDLKKMSKEKGMKMTKEINTANARKADKTGGEEPMQKIKEAAKGVKVIKGKEKVNAVEDVEVDEDMSVHLKPHATKSTHYTVTKVGSKMKKHGGVKPGEHLNDTQVDDLSDSGVKVHHESVDSKEQKEQHAMQDSYTQKYADFMTSQNLAMSPSNAVFTEQGSLGFQGASALGKSRDPRHKDAASHIDHAVRQNPDYHKPGDTGVKDRMRHAAAKKLGYNV